MFKKTLSIVLSFSIVLSTTIASFADTPEGIVTNLPEDTLTANTEEVLDPLFEDKSGEPAIHTEINSSGELVTDFTDISPKSEIVSHGDFRLNGTTLVGYVGSLENLVIPDDLGITAIAESAFSHSNARSKLKTVVIPEGVERLSGFANCRYLEEVTLPSTLITIEDRAFYYCESLTSITIPDSVTTIGDEAFYWCSALTSATIGNSVTTIGEHAFSYCETLASVTIPDSVTTIGDSAFYRCDSLTSVTIGNSVTTIGDSAFYSCDSLTSVTIPDSVTTIGKSAFSYCETLTTVSIPDSVITIGWQAFSHCSNLSEISVSSENQNFADIDGVLFDKNIKEIICYPSGKTNEDYIIPDSVTTIGDGAFYYCRSLTSVTIPDSVTTIGNSAFSNCSALTSVTIPDSVTTIGNSAFSNCSALTSVTIPDSVTTIGNYAFYYCVSLTSVTIPNSVTTIGDYAFAACSALTSVTIPDSVTTIGDYAFAACSALTSVTIPDSVATIGLGTFYYCSNLSEIRVSSENQNFTDIDGVLFDKNIKEIICYPSRKTNEDYIIPDSVTTIGSYAFYSCVSLTSITIPDSVTTIGDYAFSDCSALTSVTIPDSVTTIGNYAFYSCDSLTSVTIPDSVTTIGDYAFYYCSSLISATVPASVQYFGWNVFGDTGHGFTIIGYIGSPAEEYAINNGHLFVDITQNNISIDADDTTNNAVINVSGLAPKGKIVKIYDGDVEIGTFTASMNLRYGGNVTLAGGFGAHVIRAETTNNNGDKISDSKTVIYEENAPHLLEFVMYHGGQKINLITTDGIRQTLIFNPGTTFTFEAKTENSNRIKEMYVCSERGGDTKRIKAIYDDKNDIWIASGYFNPNDTSYVPGKLSIAFFGEGAESKENHMGISNGAYQIIIDPSGYIYEAVPSNRLQGVTVTTYTKENLSDPDPATKWDAREFDQANPLITDQEGRYAWDVPEGFWQVKAELSGYETAYSDWLPVPPPQTEVNIGMVSKTPPTIERVMGYEDYIEVVFSKYMDILTFDGDNVALLHDENKINTAIEFVNGEINPDNGKEYATIIRIKPLDSTFSSGGSINVNISGEVESYAGISLAADYSNPVSITIEAKSLRHVSNLFTPYGETKTITVQVLPIEAGKNKRIFARSSMPQLAGITESAVTDENGIATFTVIGNLPGEAIFTFIPDNSSLETNIRANIIMPGSTALIIGDTNGDLEINVQDVISLLRYTVGNTDGFIHKNAYINDDDEIDNRDAVYLLRAIAGFPIEKSKLFPMSA